MSVPISVHKNAVGIVEEALKDPLSKRDSLPSSFESKETKVRRFSNPSCLRKPSDFINENRKKIAEKTEETAQSAPGGKTHEGQVRNECPTSSSQDYSTFSLQEHQITQSEESAQNVQGHSTRQNECQQMMESEQNHLWRKEESAQYGHRNQQNQSPQMIEGRQDHSWHEGESAQYVQAQNTQQNQCLQMIDGRQDHSWQESSQHVQGHSTQQNPEMIEGDQHQSSQYVHNFEQNQCPQMTHGKQDHWHKEESSEYVHGHRNQQTQCPQMLEGRQNHSRQKEESTQFVQAQNTQQNECQQMESEQNHFWRKEESAQHVQGHRNQQNECQQMMESEQNHLCRKEESAQYVQGHRNQQNLIGEKNDSCQKQDSSLQGYKTHDDQMALRNEGVLQETSNRIANSPNVERMTKKEFVEYEHKKRTFTESCYERVSRCPRSPYENVESAFRREYKEEDLKPYGRKDRSKTPYGFYDNEKPEISAETYENIRAKLGDLLGGRPIRPAKKVERKEDVEEAFRELTIKEGLLDDDDYEYYYERQSSQIASNNGSVPAPHENSGVPPPPPPPVQGNIPPVRIASEIGQKKAYEPPAAIQNAMMTKDKKPFTYTPGGLDLAEIRSPRMARRINRNAHMEDSCTPQMHQRPAGGHQPLPPSALAAMQPQIAIPVFPPGGGFQSNNSPPFPPPPPPMPTQSTNADSVDFPPPPPPLQSPGTPTSAPFPPPPPPMPENGRPSFNEPPLRSLPARPDFIAEIPSHPPLKPTNQPPRSSYDPSNANPIQIQLKPVSPKPIQNTGPPFIPTQPIYVHQKPPEVLFKENAQPPKQKSPENFNQKAEMPKPPPLQMPPVKQQTPPIKTPQTPNKSPAPWMTTRQTSKESPPPWTVKSPAESPQPSQPVTRVIPIQIEGESPQKVPQYQPVYQPQYQQPYQQPPYQQAYQPYQQQNSEEPRTRIIPIQIEGAEQRNYGAQQSVNNAPNFQRSTSADGRQLQSQNSWSPNPIQSRSFRVLQKITGSEEEPIGPFHNPGAETFLVNRVRAAPVGDCSMWDPNCPYPNPNYWYFPPQSPEEQAKFWEHYGAMCAYMAQMNAAAARYSPYPFVYPSDSEGGYSSSDEMTYYGQLFKMQQKQEAQKDSDTEEKANPLQSIKSVPDISVYKSSESSSDSESDSEDSELPLSTILEESENSDGEKGKSENSSTSTLNEEAVVVRLPLKVKISVENNEEVATVIVGDEETSPKMEESLIITDIVREDSDPDVTATIKLKRNSVVSEVSVAATVESPDFWNEIGSEDDSKHDEDDSSSTSVQTVKKGEKSEEEEDSDDQSDDSEEEEEEEEEAKAMPISSEDEESEEDDVEEQAASSDEDDEEVEEQAPAAEVTEATEDEEESESSSEEEVEEQKVETKLEESEDDSGVTDISRHETDTGSDPESERRKTYYKRAATHSRLFKLLQDECGSDEDPSSRKERLTLPLNKSEETLSSSSGINSPLSPTVTERAVKELVQSLLNRKKGRNFRKLPLEKLHAAALRILQEDMEHESSDESFFSPDSIPKGLYEEYRDYYESWANHDIVPSRTFKILESPSPSPKFTVRCPRVPTPEKPE